MVPHHDYCRIAEGSQVRMQIGLLMMGILTQPGVADRTQAYYDAALRALSEGYERLLEQWGLELIAPVTCDDLVRMLQALLVGLVIQDQAADNERHGSELFEWAASALLRSLTRPTCPEERRRPVKER